MKYLSVCSGIEAATVAWHHMGWTPVGFSEIEKFPSQVLAHHYSNVTNFGDMTKFKEWNINETIELMVGGTPCQSFSVAGLRKGLADPRGNLMLTYLAMADHFKPKWLLWENVPGVLSSNRGHDFAALLQGLAQCGYGFAYRVLDAQYFGVPQRRRRVFVIGCLGNWRSAAKVLFESESLCGDITPSRETKQEVTEVTGTLTANGGGLNRPAGNANELDFCVATWPAQTASTLNASFGSKLGLENQHINSGAPLFVPAYSIQGSMIGRDDKNGPQGDGINEDVSFTLNTTDRHGVAHPIVLEDQGGSVINTRQDGTVGTLRAQTHGHEPAIISNMAVRRLTPVECERLQGFPDNYTNILGASDSARYKALGNSMAVPVMRWIGERINEANNA